MSLSITAVFTPGCKPTLICYQSYWCLYTLQTVSDVLHSSFLCFTLFLHCYLPHNSMDGTYSLLVIFCLFVQFRISRHQRERQIGTVVVHNLWLIVVFRVTYPWVGDGVCLLKPQVRWVILLTVSCSLWSCPVDQANYWLSFFVTCDNRSTCHVAAMTGLNCCFAELHCVGHVNESKPVPTWSHPQAGKSTSMQKWNSPQCVHCASPLYRCCYGASNDCRHLQLSGSYGVIQMQSVHTWSCSWGGMCHAARDYSVEGQMHNPRKRGTWPLT